MSALMGEWRDQARCQFEDSAPFFDERRAEEAKTICRACPVVNECLKAALAAGEGEAGVRGVWGATTEVERRSIRRRGHKQAARARQSA